MWLEVNEETAFANFDALLALSCHVKPLGCKLGIEHFGRSLHEFGRLQQLALDYLKVDMSFVRNLHLNTGHQSFLKGLLWMAHNLGVQVYAEGVALQEELDAVKALGFDGATGVYVK